MICHLAIDHHLLRLICGNERTTLKAIIDQVHVRVTFGRLRVVERGVFAVTAGADSSACYAGTYLMTWKVADNDAKLQTLAWQDVEVDIGECK